MKKTVYLCFVLLAGIGCSKNESPTNSKSATQLSELNINQNFDWSSSRKGNVSATISSNNLNVEGTIVQLVQDDVVLDRAFITNGTVDFSINVPQNSADIYLYYPNTEEIISVNFNGVNTFEVGNIDRTIALSDTSINKKMFLTNGSIAQVASNKTMVDVIVNGDFETNDVGVDSRAYTELRPVGKWYKTSTTLGSLSQVSGSEVYINTDFDTMEGIQQAVAASENTSFTASFNYGGDRVYGVSASAYVDYFDASGIWLGQNVMLMFSRVRSNASSSLTTTTPANTAYIQFSFYSRRSSWVDNVSLDITVSIPDSDNDGVIDSQDDYPSDAARAYTSTYPSAGYQTLAFEDLWPFQGDYDFNDIVVSNQVTWVKNANNELVEAIFNVSLDAVGSGYANGLALVLLDASNNTLSQNILASVSGDATLDPNVTNGVIIFNDVFAAQSSYYQNNNEGPSATPDVFAFTITFNTNVGTQSLSPDTYLFRTAQRGLEIHLPGYTGTSAADASLNNTGEDLNGTYRTSSGLPWAIEVVTASKTFKHPSEKVDIIQAYPSFQTWAESEGTQATDWLDNQVTSLIFDVL